MSKVKTFVYFLSSLFLLMSCGRTTPIKDYVIPSTDNVAPIKLTDVQLKTLFNVYMYQTCRENGLKVRHVPATGALSDYTYKFESLDGIPLTVKDNSYILLNGDGRTGRVKSTVIKNQVQWTETISHTTCNHDSQPTDCPDNTNTLTVSNIFPTLNEIIEVKWNGTLQKDQVLYHFGQGYQLMETLNATTVRVKITDTFFHIQCQPSVSIYDGCHGWTAFTGNIVK